MQNNCLKCKSHQTLRFLSGIALTVAMLVPSRPGLCAADTESLPSSTSSPQSLVLFPEAISFQYLGEHQQVMVLAKMADGSTVDVTDEVRLTLVDDQRPGEILEGKRLRATLSGAAQLRAFWNGLTTTANVTSRAEATTRPLRFGKFCKSSRLQAGARPA